MASGVDECDSRGLRAYIEAFLDAPTGSGAESDADSDGLLHEIAAKSMELQSKIQYCVESKEKGKQETALLRDVVMKLQMQMVGAGDDGASLADLHEKYLSLENEFQVTLFESKIHELSQYVSPAAVPQLVLNIVELSKNSNLRISREIKLKEYLLKVINDILS